MEGIEPIYESKKHNGMKWLKIFVFFAFFLLIGFLIYSTSSGFGNFSFTGGVIDNLPFVGPDKAAAGLENGYGIQASLDGLPLLNLDGNFGKVELIGSSSEFVAGSQKFSLSTLDNYVVLTNYSGSFDVVEIAGTGNVTKRVINLKGKALGVSVNGIQIENKKGDLIKVSTKEFGFDSFDLSQTPIFKKIDFTTSGEIVIDSVNSLVLDKEELTLKNFEGNLNYENSDTKLNGKVLSLEVSGDRSVVFE